MAEPFKSTPASRVFGMGLPRRKVDNPGTIFGIEVDEPRWSLDPRLRRDMNEEQQLSMQEQALDAQQQYLQRQQRVAAAEDAAIAGIEAGEDIGNIFKNNPSLALSRNFNQFSNMAEMVRPSKATQTLAPSIAKSIPAPYRDKYMALVNGQYAQDPLGAKTAVETEMGIDEQRGRLRKMGVDTSKLERRLYTPEEEADFEFRVKNDDPLSFYEKRKNLALERLKLWEDRDDTQIPDPKNPTLFVENPEFTKAKTLAMQAMDEHDAELLRRINPQAAATATNITSTAAMGGVAPTQLAPAVEAQKPLVDIDTQLESLPFAEQKAFLEKKNAEEAALKEIAPAWDKAKTDIEKQILKVVPDKPLPGTKVNELESFAKAVLNPNENIITHPEYGTIPVAWDILNKAGVPMADIMKNKTVFRQPGEGRRLFGVIGTQQVGYQELLKEWAKSFLNSRGKLLPTSQSPSGSTLTEQQQKDLDELSSLVRSK